MAAATPSLGSQSLAAWSAQNMPASSATPLLPKLLGHLSAGQRDSSVKSLQPQVHQLGSDVFANSHSLSTQMVAATETLPFEFERSCRMFAKIDADGDGSISMLELFAAVQQDSAVAKFVLPGVDTSQVMNNEDAFDAVDSVFGLMAGGNKRVTRETFLEYFSKADNDGLREIFQKIDTDGSGTISKLELLAAVKRDDSIATFMHPGDVEGRRVLCDQDCFDNIGQMFDAMSRGKRRADFSEFRSFFQKRVGLAGHRRQRSDGTIMRNQHRLLVIGSGFCCNPQLASQIAQAGYQVRWVNDLPDPEQLGPQISTYLGHLKSAMDEFQPHVLLCASKGGLYMSALWLNNLWQGPTVMINAHPHIRYLPSGVRIVLAHGSEDEVYRRTREDLELMMSKTSPNSCYLHYVGCSGMLSGGQRSRIGDHHAMVSLLAYDTLPRLVDASLSDESPDVHMIRSWQMRLSDQRMAAERWLGYTLDKLRQRWTSSNRQGLDAQKVFQLTPGSDEFHCVAAIFKAAPREAPAYGGCDQSAWERGGIIRIERVENGAQESGSARAYAESMQRSLEDQGIAFEPGLHTRWGFHGTDAIESIVNNPMSGFQPLAAGTKGASLWGSGTYFARDAKYVHDGQFCGTPAPDGSRRILMCLLSTGMPCFGSPDHRGVLPLRQGIHRYDSTIDSLSNPEIFILQNPGAAYPAYVITFL